MISCSSALQIDFWIAAKKKEEVALLIAASVASDNIYASIGRLGMTMERDGPVAAGGAEKRAYRSKLVRPKAVTKTGLYFCAISLWFSAQNRHLVLATGKKMNRVYVRCGMCFPAIQHVHVDSRLCWLHRRLPQ
jgi:hypothetical protein